MKSTYKQIPMAARYLINTVLIIAFLVVGNLIISSGLINRAQSSVGAPGGESISSWLFP